MVNRYGAIDGPAWAAAASAVAGHGSAPPAVSRVPVVSAPPVIPVARAIVPRPDVRMPVWRPERVPASEYRGRVEVERRRLRENADVLAECAQSSLDVVRKFPELIVSIDRPLPIRGGSVSRSREERIVELMPHTLFPMWYQQSATARTTLHLGETVGFEDELTMYRAMNEIVEPMRRFATNDSPPPHWLVAMRSPILSLAQPAANVIHAGTTVHILQDFPIALDRTHAALDVVPTVSDWGRSYAAVKAVSDVTGPALQDLIGRNLWTTALDSFVTPLVHQGIFVIRNEPYKRAVRRHAGQDVAVEFPAEEVIKAAKTAELSQFPR